MFDLKDEFDTIKPLTLPCNCTALGSHDITLSIFSCYLSKPFFSVSFTGSYSFLLPISIGILEDSVLSYSLLTSISLESVSLHGFHYHLAYI